MLRINIIPNSDSAKAYYRSSDYHLAGLETPAYWHGKAAEKLGLSGVVQWDDFERMAENRHPETGKQLTAKHIENRRVGYDFTFSVPKSVSLAYALGGDDRITDAFRGAVRDTMAEIEREMETRVRKNYQFANRTTGNIVWADFLHHTSRPINGQPDPQLHIHAVVFNATHDPVEQRWKAGEFARIKSNAPYFQAVFRTRLANRLQNLGYSVTCKKNDFEIFGVPPRAIKEFSRRTDLIEKTAERLGVTRPETKAKLGATTREPKKEALTWGELQEMWQERLKPGEMEATLKSRRDSPLTFVDRSRESVDYALAHLLERNSTTPERFVVTEALKYGLGNVTPESVWQEMKRPGLIRREVDGTQYVTTNEVLNEEKEIVNFAKRGKGKFMPLGSLTNEVPDFFTKGQKHAAEHAWESHDQVILIRGIAGTGKTTLVKTLLSGVNVPHVVLAPSAEASRGVLRREGFQNADTLAKFLGDEKLQRQAKNGLIVLDEASLTGSRDMARLFQLADSLDSRVLLLGDKRQHKSVARGDVLKLLEDNAKLPVAEVLNIRRQKGTYKQAVELASQGSISDSFDTLDRLGWVREGGLVDDYVDALQKKKKVLVVSPTHAEGEAVTAEIRQRLKEEGVLKDDERTFTRLVPLHLTEAEKNREESYEAGDIVRFIRSVGDFKAGQRVRVSESNIPDLARVGNKLAVFREDTIRLAAGDTIRVTANGKDASGNHRLNNGAVYTVDRFTSDGDIKLSNGWTLPKDFGLLNHGYVVTSHASQGKTVDRVLVAQSSTSFPASGKEQFYVSISRGKHQATIYTDDKIALKKAIQREDGRVLASDLVQEKKDKMRRRLKKRVAFLRGLANLPSALKRMMQRDHYEHDRSVTR